MLFLTEDSLGKRQKELNAKIDEAVANNIKLDEFKAEIDESDIDRLFKIGVASKYKDYCYIVEVLKSGDCLCISKALKCNWIYNDEFSAIIEPGYLHTNVFPFMSDKMKNKMLYTISKYVRNESRAYSFYMYCKAQKMYNMSYKFIIFAAESFKLEEITADNRIVTHRKGYLKKFISNSFNLADAYLNTFENMIRNKHLNELFYLYNNSSEKFLDLFEKYYDCYAWPKISFNVRLSEDIMENHRDRFNSKYPFYFGLLNFDILAKHISVEEAKDYIKKMFNREVNCDLENDFDSFSILDLLPSNERFQFIKKLHMDRYGKEIEMDLDFFEHNTYKIMTVEEREAWALRHLEIGTQWFGPGKNYIWYRFIHIDKSLPELQKYLLVATKGDQRVKILYNLVRCARCPEHIEKLLNYYHSRHVNEEIDYKEKFVDFVLKIHNVYEFDEKCWKALEKILCSMDLYDTTGRTKCKPEYRNIAVIYHLLNKKDISLGLMRYMDLYLNIEDFRSTSKTLSKEKDDMICNGLLQHYVNKLQELTDQENKKGYVNRILDMLHNYNKTIEDCPDIVLDVAKQDLRFKKKKVLAVKGYFNQDILIRKLKYNVGSFLSDLEKVKEHIYKSRRFDLRRLLKKLKIYFNNDIAKDYIKLFEEILISQKKSPKIHKRLIYTAVHGIFQLADAHYIQDFMIKHAPLKRRADYIESDPILLFTQYAICRCSCLPRPPAPLSCTLLYIKEDYLQYCSSTFSSFMANLATTPRFEFIIALLDNAPSIQTHALRMLFSCFTPDHIDYARKAWNKTEDVQVRKVLYTKLFETLLHIETEQEQVYELLLSCTVDLREDDHDDVYNLLSSDRMLGKFAAEYLTTAWTTVEKLPVWGRYISIRSNIIKNIENRLDILSKGFVFDIIEKHIQKIMKNKEILQFRDNEPRYEWLQPEIDESDPFYTFTSEELNVVKLNNNKWNLMKKCVLKFDDKDSVDISIRLMKLMIEQLSQIWNKMVFDIYYVRKFFAKFITDLQTMSYDLNQNLPITDLILETILEETQKSLSIYHTYLLIWDLKLTLISRKVLHYGKPDVQDRGNHEIVIKVCSHYGKELGNLILEFVDKKLFYKGFMGEIRDRIKGSIYRFLGSLPQSQERFYYNNFYDNVHYIYDSFVELNTTEVLSITLKLFPDFDGSRYPGWSTCDIGNYNNVIKKIDEFGNVEASHYLSKKYVCYNYK